MDLERLFLQPGRVRKFAVDLASQLRIFEPEVVCGPLVEGAFVGLMVAEELKIDFIYSERFDTANREILFPVKYRIPPPLRRTIAGRRVAIVNDVINAGSAIRGTFTDLVEAGAIPVAIAALLVLGPAAAEHAAEHDLALISLASLSHDLWTPAGCPLCARGQDLEDPATRSTPG